MSFEELDRNASRAQQQLAAALDQLRTARKQASNEVQEWWDAWRAEQAASAEPLEDDQASPPDPEQFPYVVAAVDALIEANAAVCESGSEFHAFVNANM